MTRPTSPASTSAPRYCSAAGPGLRSRRRLTLRQPYGGEGCRVTAPVRAGACAARSWRHRRCRRGGPGPAARRRRSPGGGARGGRVSAQPVQSVIDGGVWGLDQSVGVEQERGPGREDGDGAGARSGDRVNGLAHRVTRAATGRRRAGPTRTRVFTTSAHSTGRQEHGSCRGRPVGEGATTRGPAGGVGRPDHRRRHRARVRCGRRPGRRGRGSRRVVIPEVLGKEGQRTEGG